MANNQANIKAVITADDRASGVLKGFGDNVHSIAGRVGSLIKTAAEGLAIGAAAAAAFGAVSVKAFMEAEAGIAQTNAVLTSTKNVAGVTADEVDRLSKALQKTTKFSDEEVRSAENLLLTFTAIGKDIFPQATKTVLNMATALGEDTKSASIQLGKALQDPILGVTALRRVGVNFNDAQKDVIKNLVETGRSAEAQRLILKELETEFGGSAEAAGNTFGGSLVKLKNQLNDVQEKIGESIVKYLVPFAQRATEALNSVDWDAVISRTIDALVRFGKSISDFVRSVAPTLKQWAANIAEVARQVADYLGPKLEALWNTIETKLIPTLIRLWKEVLEPLMPVIGTALVIALGLLIDALNLGITVWAAYANTMQTVTNVYVALWQTFIHWINVAFGWVADRINEFKGWFNSLPGFVQNALAGITGIITAPFTAAFNAILYGVDMVKRAVRDIPGSIASTGGNTLQNLLDPLKIFHRAGGGPVSSGSPYIVGEQGPELFVPGSSGNIVPNGAGSGGTINITIQAGALMGNDVEARKFAQVILGHLKDAANSKSTSISKLMGY